MTRNEISEGAVLIQEHYAFAGESDVRHAHDGHGNWQIIFRPPDGHIFLKADRLDDLRCHLQGKQVLFIYEGDVNCLVKGQRKED